MMDIDGIPKVILSAIVELRWAKWLAQQAFLSGIVICI